MSRLTAVSLLALVLLAHAVAQGHKALYPKMAPVDQYLMDRDAEIALAKSAAPASISRDAKVLVLGRHGYETAIEGKNGFVCAVERSWMAPPRDTDPDSEFWNPKIRGPLCFNPAAARSVLPITIMRTEFVLSGQSKAQILENTKAALEKKELPPLQPGAMCYMMSKEAYLTDSGSHNLAHLMFYTPVLDSTALGADLPGSPVMLNPQFQGAPEPLSVFIVPVAKWSDGTVAPVM